MPVPRQKGLVLFISVVTGVLIASKVSGYRSMFNAVGIVVIYALFSYLLSQSPSNLEKAYPTWFIICSYIVLLPSAVFGHYILKFGGQKDE